MRKETKWLAAALAGAGLALTGPQVHAQKVQGVTDKEIVIGSILDLSGPAAGFGRELGDGMRMRVDEINREGGIHGRNLRLVIEDSGYEPRRGVLAAQKLIQRDRVFAVVGTLGTPIVMSTMPAILNAGVVHAFPAGPSRHTFEPASPLKYAINMSYDMYGPYMVNYLQEQRADRKYCSLMQDDEFGQELMQGLEPALKEAGQKFIVRTTYKRGATDFSSQIARMNAAGCDTVLLGTVIRETIGAMAAARKIGFDADFMVSVAAFSTLVPQLGKGVVEGLYGVGTLVLPERDSPDERTRQWFADFESRYKTEPGQFSPVGYKMVDWIAYGMKQAGPELTAEAFNKAMVEHPQPNDLGFNNLRFTNENRLGSTAARVYQIKDGRWEDRSGTLDFHKTDDSSESVSLAAPASEG